MPGENIIVNLPNNILIIDYVTWGVLLLIICITVMLNFQLINMSRKIYSTVKTRQMERDECAGRYFEFETARYMLQYEGVGSENLQSMRDMMDNGGYIETNYTNMMNWMWLLLAICILNLLVYLIKCWRANGIEEKGVKEIMDWSAFSGKNGGNMKGDADPDPNAPAPATGHDLQQNLIKLGPDYIKNEVLKPLRNLNADIFEQTGIDHTGSDGIQKVDALRATKVPQTNPVAATVTAPAAHGPAAAANGLKPSVGIFQSFFGKRTSNADTSATAATSAKIVSATSNAKWYEFLVIIEFLFGIKLENNGMVVPWVLANMNTFKVLPDYCGKLYDNNYIKNIAYILGWFVVMVQTGFAMMPPVLFSGLNPDFLNYIKNHNQWVSWLAYMPLIVLLYMEYNVIEMITSTNSLGYIILDMILILSVAFIITLSLRNHSLNNLFTSNNNNATLADNVNSWLGVYNSHIQTLEGGLRALISGWYIKNGQMSKDINTLRNIALNTIGQNSTVSGYDIDVVQGAQAFLCLIDGLKNVGNKSDDEINTLFKDTTFNKVSAYDVISGQNENQYFPILSKYVCYEPTHLQYLRKLRNLDLYISHVESDAPDDGLRDKMLTLIYVAAIFISIFVYLLFIVGSDYGIYYMSILTIASVIITALIYFYLHVLVIQPANSTF